MIELIKKILNPGGIIFIQVPNDFSKYQEMLLENNLVTEKYWVSYPEHLHYFNSKSLQNILESQGLEKLDFFSTFPIDWFLANPNSSYVNDRSKGKAAHLARILIENIISREGIVKSNEFYRSLANVGLGRDLCTLYRM